MESSQREWKGRIIATICWCSSEGSSQRGDPTE
jgi:hypothetical protein